eukprot:748675-Hanusia_phi.AAC.2
MAEHSCKKISEVTKQTQDMTDRPGAVCAQHKDTSIRLLPSSVRVSSCQDGGALQCNDCCGGGALVEE